jgi:hypothetical protein
VRQVGAVLGSAATAALMEARLTAHHLAPDAFGQTGGRMAPADIAPFAAAMGESLLLPAATLALGLVAVLLYERPSHHAESSPAVA